MVADDRAIALWIGSLLGCLLFFSCGVLSTTYRVTKGTVVVTYMATKGLIKAGIGTGVIVYKIGEFTFRVAKAPIEWSLTREEIDSIDGLPPKEAIRKSRVKCSPYVVHGKRYVPMSVEESRNYREDGIASWYGEETLRKEGGFMTANGEAFDPDNLSAAHKHLPLPTHAKVTNLENGRSVIVRVNDRGPFVKGRLIDLTAGSAKKLGFYEKGTARVRVETVVLEE